MERRTVISGLGFYVPPKVVTNFDLEKMMNTSDEWIRERTGILERHWAEPGVGTSDLAYQAALQAIENAGIDKNEIDFIVAATLSPDHYFPGIGLMVQAKLGLKEIGALDIRHQCSGFLYALSVADQYLRTGTYKKILLVAAELQSANLDFSDEGRDMSVLFGDGGAALILEANDSGDGRGLLGCFLFSDGRFVNELWMDKPSSLDNPTFQLEFFHQGKFFPRMNGRAVFKNACEKMPQAVLYGLQQLGLTVADIDYLIPHQANDRISQMVGRGLKLPEEKVIRNIQRYGNTTAASIPIALTEAVQNGLIKKGNLLALTAFGSGFTWGSAFLRW
jgi:3-oxoacyl-[acyl-carrier-protein] synthase-3